MGKTVSMYIRSQGIAAAVFNMVLNPAFAWLGNRKMAFVGLWGDGNILLDTFLTSMIVSLLVTLFTAAGVGRELKKHRLSTIPGSSVLNRLPPKPFALGLVIGACAELVLFPVTMGLFCFLGLSGLSFAQFVLFKIIYTGPLGFFVARLVILRFLQAGGQP
jgi:hypothetical protein